MSSTPGTCLRYRGHLRTSPFPGELAPSEPLQMLLMGEGDYVSLQAYENDAPQPVLLAYAQHYRLLDDLVRRALAELPAVTHILVRFHTVYLRPLPEGLMRPQVLLVDDPQAAADRLLREGVGELLVISDRFRRDGKEQGDNSVDIALHTARTDPGVRSDFAAWLRGAAFYRGTDGGPDGPAVTVCDAPAAGH